MQLVAYGAQDIYLTGNPQITFFKVVYRRHTNFSMESIQQTFNGQADFGRRVTCTISRNGDLVHRMYLQVTLPQWQAAPGYGWADWIGHALIKNVEVEIGGQRIDKQYGEWLHVWNELTQCAGKKLGYGSMVGQDVKGYGNFLVGDGGTTGVTQYDRYDVAHDTVGIVPKTTLYVPLEFWFNRNPGLALPLIALQYHEVKINIEFNDKNNCVDVNVKAFTGANAGALTGSAQSGDAVKPFDGTGSLLRDVAPSIGEATLYVDYIYLDTDERRRFAQVSHEYLIEQLQFTGDETAIKGANKFKLNFNHPCKELIWVTRSGESEGYNQWFNFTTNAKQINYPSGGVNPLIDAKLQLNGHDRFSEREGTYFSFVQPYQHHENVPAERGINVYSFALKPEEHQPSGSCNFSRIDNATLSVHLALDPFFTVGSTAGVYDVSNANTGVTKIFAVNYNVLRIMSGMGGLAYSN